MNIFFIFMFILTSTIAYVHMSFSRKWNAQNVYTSPKFEESGIIWNWNLHQGFLLAIWLLLISSVFSHGQSIFYRLDCTEFGHIFSNTVILMCYFLSGSSEWLSKWVIMFRGQCDSKGFLKRSVTLYEWSLHMWYQVCTSSN